MSFGVYFDKESIKGFLTENKDILERLFFNQISIGKAIEALQQISEGKTPVLPSDDPTSFYDMFYPEWKKATTYIGDPLRLFSPEAMYDVITTQHDIGLNWKKKYERLCELLKRDPNEPI